MALAGFDTGFSDGGDGPQDSLEALKAEGLRAWKEASRIQSEAGEQRSQAAGHLTAAKEHERQAVEALERSWQHETLQARAAAGEQRRRFEKSWNLAKMNIEAAATKNELAAVLELKAHELRSRSLALAERVRARK